MRATWLDWLAVQPDARRPVMHAPTRRIIVPDTKNGLAGRAIAATAACGPKEKMMWSPGLTLSTSSLFSRTIPAASWPSTIGGGQSPFMMCQSLMQTPAALARTRTLLGLRRLLLEIKDLQGFGDFG